MIGSSSSTQVIKGPDINFNLFSSYLQSLENYAQTFDKDAADLTNEETIAFQEKISMPVGIGANAPSPGTEEQFKKDLERTDSISFIRDNKDNTIFQYFPESIVSLFKKIKQDNNINQTTIKIKDSPPIQEANIQNAFQSLGLDDEKTKLLKSWMHQGGLARIHQQIFYFNQAHQQLDFYHKTGKQVHGITDYIGLFGYAVSPGDQSPPILIFQNNNNNPDNIELIIKAPINRIRASYREKEEVIAWAKEPDIETVSVTKLSISISKFNNDHSKLSYIIDKAYLESSFDSSNLTREELSALDKKARNQMDKLLPFLGTEVPNSLFSKEDLAQEKLPDWNPLPNKTKYEYKNQSIFDSIKTIAFDSLSMLMSQYILPLVSPLGALSHGIASSFSLLINSFNPWSKKINLQETKHAENSCDYPPKKETSVTSISQDNDFKENKNESTSLFSRIFKWSHHDIPEPNDSSKNKKSF